ncbi:MAG: hypothetical protein IJZ19_03070 [Lentisphaeria bacterium]|nr:hypothetical protein [Lentisphaeria bacterium]
MIVCILIFWAIPFAAIFGGTAFKPIQSYLWAVCALLAFYFGAMSPAVSEAIFGLLPASWSDGREQLLMLIIGVPVFTFLAAVITHTFCPVDFGVFKLPKGFNLVVSGINGFLFGVVLTDLLMLIILVSSIHNQIPEKYNEEFRKMTLSRSMVTVSIVNRALNNSDMNISCRKNLENLLYKKRGEKVEGKKVSLGVADRVTNAVFGRTMKTVEVLNKAIDNNESTAKARQQLGDLLKVDIGGEEHVKPEEGKAPERDTRPVKAPVERTRMQVKNEAGGEQTYKPLAPERKKRSKKQSTSSAPASVYGRSIQKARDVRSATEARSRRDAEFK